MSSRHPFLSSLRTGLSAGLLWTAGFFAAFPLFRYAHLFGVVPLGLLVGSLLILLLTRRGWKGWFEGVLAALFVCLSSTLLLWNLPWFNTMLLTLYQGFHITEAGFAGLFTILFYVGTSLLWFFLLSGVCLTWKSRTAGKEGEERNIQGHSKEKDL